MLSLLAVILLYASVSLTLIVLPFPDGGEQPLASHSPGDSQEAEVTVFPAVAQVIAIWISYGYNSLIHSQQAEGQR